MFTVFHTESLWIGTDLKKFNEIRDALDAGNFASYKEEKLYSMGQINREKEMEK